MTFGVLELSLKLLGWEVASGVIKKVARGGDSQPYSKCTCAFGLHRKSKLLTLSAMVKPGKDGLY